MSGETIMRKPDTAPSPRLSLGPISYYWPKNQVDDFYAMVADAPVDTFHRSFFIVPLRSVTRTDEPPLPARL